jgi:hypothetical protein
MFPCQSVIAYNAKAVWGEFEQRSGESEATFGFEPGLS